MGASSPESLRHFIRSHFTLTLATAVGSTPWAAAVYYVSDDALNLYFISDPQSRHVREGLQSGHVAVAIHGAHQPWTTLTGVQMEARIAIVPAQERESVERLFLARFSDVAWAMRHPVGPGGSRVAEKFAASCFYRITPVRARLIDNSRGFGKPEEFDL